MTSASPPSVASVAGGLGLPADLMPWLDSLALTGPPGEGLRLPGGDEAAELLGRLGVVEPDLSVIVSAIPSRETQPELWWLLERAVQEARGAVGRWDAAGLAPSLPAGLGVQGRCFWVFVFLAVAGDVRRWHARQGIPEDVSWATMADLGRHVARHRRREGTTGLDSQWWIGIHFRGAMYQLGRLQFNPYRLRTGMAGPRFWYEGEAVAARGPGFQPGDPVLGVHIPAGSALDPDACEESFAMAGPFFRRHFPGEAAGIATCTSWLLDEQLAEHLHPSSNIVRFQRRFELVPGAADDDDAVFAFVFDRAAGSLDELPQTTELERVMVRHVRAGGHWRVRTGWLRV